MVRLGCDLRRTRNCVTLCHLRSIFARVALPHGAVTFVDFGMASTHKLDSKRLDKLIVDSIHCKPVGSAASGNFVRSSVTQLLMLP